MSHFVRTTAFEIVRQLAATGAESPSLYLLVCEPADFAAVQEEIRVEIHVQLGVTARILPGVKSKAVASHDV
jgi:hypothetical protein